MIVRGGIPEDADARTDRGGGSVFKVTDFKAIDKLEVVGGFPRIRGANDQVVEKGPITDRRAPDVLESQGRLMAGKGAAELKVGEAGAGGEVVGLDGG